MVPRQLGGCRSVDKRQPQRLGVDACEDAVPDSQHLAVELLRLTVAGTTRTASTQCNVVIAEKSIFL